MVKALTGNDVACCIAHNTAAESKPPLSSVPSGTSLIICRATAARTAASSRSTLSARAPVLRAVGIGQPEPTLDFNAAPLGQQPLTRQQLADPLEPGRRRRHVREREEGVEGRPVRPPLRLPDHSGSL